jgi:hypothetical protein
MKKKTMNKSPRKRFAAWRPLPLMAALLVLAGCAGMGKPPEEVVRERAQERLDYLLAKDSAAAYEYLSPGYRSGFSLEDYQRKLLTQRTQWTGATVGKSDCSEDTCKVRIVIEYTVVGAVPGVTRFDSKGASQEDWIKVSGEWYMVPPN